jgi:hypothetical protein
MQPCPQPSCEGLLQPKCDKLLGNSNLPRTRAVCNKQEQQLHKFPSLRKYADRAEPRAQNDVRNIPRASERALARWLAPYVNIPLHEHPRPIQKKKSIPLIRVPLPGTPPVALPGQRRSCRLGERQTFILIRATENRRLWKSTPVRVQM